jgi:hypothetical protein
MINILSVNCGLAFAPYLAECARSFLSEQSASARVIRQGGTGLIIRAEDSFSVRYQEREAILSREEACHYLETLDFRVESFDVRRTSDELVFSNVGRSLMISYPQSDLWLDAETVAQLITIYDRNSGTVDEEINDALNLPDWLTVSTSAGRLLMSDQRNGRWSLLGADHMAELERRLGPLRSAYDALRPPKPPTLSLKGVTVHLQSAFKLAAALETFAETGEVSAFDDVAPLFELKVAKAIEGIEIRDSLGRVGVTKREAAKWAAIIRGELERVNAAVIERGAIRTVVATGDQGRWVLQWGDEVFVPARLLGLLSAAPEQFHEQDASLPVVKKSAGLLLLLGREDGGCVALTESEVAMLTQAGAPESGQ